MPELKKNILNFGYGINVKYERMLVHSFDRFYVAIKFILPTVNDLKFSTINFNETYNYLQEKNIVPQLNNIFMILYSIAER